MVSTKIGINCFNAIKLKKNKDLPNINDESPRLFKREENNQDNIDQKKPLNEDKPQFIRKNKRKNENPCRSLQYSFIHYDSDCEKYQIGDKQYEKVKHNNLNLKNKFFEAIKSENIEYIKKALAEGADPNNMSNDKSYPPPLIFVLFPKPMIKEWKVKCSYNEKIIWTTNKYEIIKLLLENKADIHVSFKGTPLLELAIKNGEERLVQLILDKKNNTQLETINDRQIDNLAKIAIHHNRYIFLDYLENAKKYKISTDKKMRIH